MHKVKSAAKFLSTAFGLALAVGLIGSASAQPVDPRIDVDFTQIAPSNNVVSQSRDGLSTFVTYKFYINNKTTNDLNRVFFSSTWKNAGGEPIEFDEFLASFEFTEKFKCTKGNDGTNTTLSCSLPSLSPTNGTLSSSIYVIAKAPEEGQKIEIVWSGGGYEGNGFGNGCCAAGNTIYTSLTERTTDTIYKSQVQSFVKNKNAKLFTGDKYVTKLGDPSTTYVQIPDLGAYDKANLDQYVGIITETGVKADNNNRDCKNLNKFKTCFNAEVTIPKANVRNTAVTQILPEKLLNILIRIDSAEIRPNAKIEDTTLYYYDDPLDKSTKVTVFECTYSYGDPVVNDVQTKYVTTQYSTSGVPTNLPCWYKRVKWTSEITGWSIDLDNDFEWGVYHDKNGGYAFF